ncbi:MAG: aldo/keto reductase, partial [Flavobacteriaceae bacterium]|nr:aldo/keto reductase [Flavobacteriaceae bacterium]
MRKTILLSLVCMFVATVIFAQKIITVHKTDQTTETFNSTDVDSIQFSANETTMRFYTADGTFNFSVSGIDSIIVVQVQEPPGEGPADVSNITSVGNVPLLTLNNGVQIPQLGLGTQIQSLENDASENGRQLLNATSHNAVVAALQSGYRHLDGAHAYHNETGVGQAIIDSGVPREEIWVTSKLWPSEYGEGTTMQAIDAMLAR